MFNKTLMKRLLILAAVIVLVTAMTVPALPAGVIYAEETADGSEGDVVYEGEGEETEESEEDEDSDEASEQKDQDSDETGEEAGEDQGKEADQDFTAYGEDEGFAIVPVCAGGSSVDADETTGAIRIRKTSRNNNQAWRIRRSGGC